LAGLSPLQRAYHVAQGSNCLQIVITTDADISAYDRHRYDTVWIQRPPELAQDSTPMVDVVRHALAQVPGPDDQIVVLLQPTQPLRQPKHVRAAIALLQTSGADSVVSIVSAPSIDKLLGLYKGQLHGYQETHDGWGVEYALGNLPERRQDCEPSYLRDGTVYACWRRTVTTSGTIYGERAVPLIIPASESCALDTSEDWIEAERRLTEAR
jgi:N-acylneuraminate cytidylyltransferase